MMNQEIDNIDKEIEKIAVLIPCYNESKTIAKVISDLNITVRRSRQSGVARATCPD